MGVKRYKETGEKMRAAGNFTRGSAALIPSPQLSERKDVKSPWTEKQSVLQEKFAGKSYEIPAVRELLEQLELGGCLIVADALNCQKETARTILSGEGDCCHCSGSTMMNDSSCILKE